MLPPEGRSGEGGRGVERGEEREGEEDYVVLGVAVAVSAVATVLTFLLCYQVTGSLSTVPQAFSCFIFLLCFPI